jgi:bisphosphoglycerate-dependent phosphoglycerate mutase
LPGDILKKTAEAENWGMTVKKLDRSEGLRIFLLRHGKPDFPDARSYIYGQTDFPLSPLGVKQAKTLGRALSGIPMGRIVASDLVRASGTAEIVAGLQREKLCSVESDASLLHYITTDDPRETEALFAAARKIRERYYGTGVYFRGLIEFTNYCKNNCYYCGIRRDNVQTPD